MPKLPPKSLKYGDIIVLSLDSQKNVMTYGGYLASDDIDSAARRLSQDDSNSHIRIIPCRQGGKSPANFYSCCIYKIDTGVGYESAGEPVRYGSTIRLILRRTEEFIVSVASQLQALGKESTSILELQELTESIPSNASNFTVLPSYKTKSEGEIIYYGDLIVLHDIHGKYLYADIRSERNSPVSASPTFKTFFRILSFLSAEDSYHGYLKAGDLLRFYHRHGDSYLSVSPNELLSNIFSYIDDNTYKMKYNNNKIENMLTNAPSTSLLLSSQFLMIELIDSDIFPYGIISWDSKFRLYHVITGSYLAVNYDNSIYLTTKIDNINTVFNFSSASKTMEDSAINTNNHTNNKINSRNQVQTHTINKGHVMFGSDVRITHCHTNNSFFIVLNETNDNYNQKYFHKTTTNQRRRKSNMIQISRRKSSLEEYNNNNINEDKLDNEKLPTPQLFPNDEDNEIVLTSRTENDNSDNLNPSQLNNESDASITNNLEVEEVEEEPEGKLLVAKDNKTDKDIFMITLVSMEQNKLLGHCLIAQKILQIELRIILTSKGVYSKTAIDALIFTLQKILQLFHDLGKNKSNNASMITFLQSTLIELGFVELFLYIAKIHADHYDRNESFKVIVDNCYLLLGYVIEGNKDSVKRVIDANGVKQMVSHLSKRCRPPLDAVIETSLMVDAQGHCGVRIATITESDITHIFNGLYHQIIHGINEHSHEMYEFLALCLQTKKDYEDNYESNDILKEQQEQICNALLGSLESMPRSSMMVYRTRIFEGELQINTSVFGHCRPSISKDTMRKYHYVKEDGKNPPLNVDQEVFDECLAWMWSQRGWHQRHDSKQFYHDSENDNKYHFLNTLIERSSYQWKPLMSLTVNEAKFYCASLNLLAAITDNSNMSTQFIVRKFLPVNDILQALKISSSTSSLDYHVRCAFVRVLHCCYINSAILPPLPAVMSAPTLSWHKNMKGLIKPGSWQDVYDDEMKKVFSLATQEDEYVLQDTLSSFSSNIGSLSIDEIRHLKDSIKTEVIHCMDYVATTTESAIPFDEFFLHEKPDIQQMVDFLSLHKYQRKFDFALRNILSYVQRDELRKIVLDFFNNEAMNLVIDVNENIFDAIVANQINTTKISDENEYEWSSKIGYVQAMLSLTDTLLRRRFFDLNYSIFPKYTGHFPWLSIDALDNRLPNIVTIRDFYGVKQSPGTKYGVPEGYHLDHKDKVYDDVITETITYLINTNFTYENALQIISKTSIDLLKIMPSKNLPLAYTKTFKAINNIRFEEELDEIFNHLFEWKDDNKLRQKLFDLKELCCGIAFVTVDYIQGNIIQHLWELLNPTLFEYLIFSQEKKKEITATDSIQDKKQKQSHINIQYTEEDPHLELQSSLRAIFTKIENNPICERLLILWNFLSDFSEDKQTSLALMDLLYLNSNILRGNILLMLYRFHSLRRDIGSQLPGISIAIKSDRDSENGGNVDMEVIAKHKLDLLSLCKRIPTSNIMNNFILRDLRSLQRIFRRDDVANIFGLIDLCDYGSADISHTLKNGHKKRRKSRKDNDRRQQTEAARNASENEIVIYDMIGEFKLHEIILQFLEGQFKDCPAGEKISLFLKDKKCHPEKIMSLELCFEFLYRFSRSNIHNLKYLAIESTVHFLFRHRDFSTYVVQLLSGIFKAFENCQHYISESDLAEMVRDVSDSIVNIADVILSTSPRVHLEDESDEDNDAWELDMSFTLSHNVQTAKFTLHLLNQIVGGKGVYRNDRKILVIRLLSRILHKMTLRILICADASLSDWNPPLDFNDHVSHICQLYSKETKRKTGRKELPHLMNQPVVSFSSYHSFKEKIRKWTNLPENTFLSVHLEFIDLLATCAQGGASEDIIQLFHSLFPKSIPNVSHLIHFLSMVSFVDKIEIRLPYIRLLKGIGVDKMFTISEKDKHTSDDVYECYCTLLGILKGFAFDMRLFVLCKMFPEEMATNTISPIDVVNNTSNATANNLVASIIPDGSNVNGSGTISRVQSKVKIPAISNKSSYETNFREHCKLLENHVIECIFPFITDFLESGFSAEDPLPPHSLALSVDRFGGLSELLKLESDGTQYPIIFKSLEELNDPSFSKVDPAIVKLLRFIAQSINELLDLGVFLHYENHRVALSALLSSFSSRRINPLSDKNRLPIISMAALKMIEDNKITRFGSSPLVTPTPHYDKLQHQHFNPMLTERLSDQNLITFVRDCALPLFYSIFIEFVQSSKDKVSSNYLTRPFFLSKALSSSTSTSQDLLSFEQILDAMQDPSQSNLCQIIGVLMHGYTHFSFPNDYESYFGEGHGMKAFDITLNSASKRSSISIDKIDKVDDNSNDKNYTSIYPYPFPLSLCFGKGSTEYNVDEKKNSKPVEFKQWSRNGGRLLELLISFLREFDQRSVFSRSHSGLDVCAYWIKVLAQGSLQNNMAIILSESRKNEWTKEATMKAILAETDRIHLMQQSMKDLHAPAMVVDVVSQIGESVALFSNHPELREVVHAALLFSKELLKTGNRLIQDDIIKRVMELKLSHTVLNRKDFLLSLRSMMSYQKKYILNSNFSKSIEHEADERFITETSTLLRFLQLMCEGGNAGNKNFFRNQGTIDNINIVIQVAYLVRVLCNSLVGDISFVEDEEFISRLAPRINGVSRRMIAWFKRSSLNDLPPDLHHFMNITSIRNKSKILRVAIDVLTELTAGPCADNQMVVGLSGTLESFKKLFDFLGALQITARENDVAIMDSTESQTIFDTLWTDVVGTRITHKKIQSATSNQYYWYGNDPANFEYMLARHTRSYLPPTTGMVKSRSMLSLMKSSRAIFQNVSSEIRPSDYDDDEDIGAAGAGTGTGDRAAEMNDRHIAVIKKKRHEFLSHLSDQKRYYIANHDHYQDDDVTDETTHRSDSNIYDNIIALERDMVELESSALTLLAALLEGNAVEDNVEYAQDILLSVGENNLLCNTINYWTRFLSPSKSSIEKVLNKSRRRSIRHGRDTSNGVRRSNKMASIDNRFEKKLAYQYYTVVMRVGDFPFGSQLKAKIDKWVLENDIPINKHLAKIEVHGPELDCLVRVYFPIPKVVNDFWYSAEIEKMKIAILFPKDDKLRSSPEEKVKSFAEQSDGIIDVLRHQELLVDLSRNYFLKVFVLIARSYSLWSTLTFLMTLAVNVYLIYFAAIDPTTNDIVLRTPGTSPNFYDTNSTNASNTTTGYYSFTSEGTEFQYIAFIHIIISFLTIISFIVMWGVLKVRAGFEGNPDYLIRIESKWLRWVLSPAYYIGLLQDDAEKKSKLITVRRAILSLYYLLKQFDCTVHLLVLLFGLLGYFLYPLFFSGCLLQAIAMSRLIKYVISAFTTNWSQVFVTVILTAIAIFIFVNIAFSFSGIRDQYQLDSHWGCDSLEACYRVHLDYGWFAAPSWNDNGFVSSPISSIYNFLFRFIIDLVAPAVVSGIIIDTFSSLREMKESIESDIADRCFICNIDREDFEQMNIKFSSHLQDDHNMWKYIWFMVHLKEKDDTEFTGVENFCAERIKDRNWTRWIPVKKAGILRTTRVKYDLYSLYTKVTELGMKIMKIEDKMQDMSKCITAGVNEQVFRLEAKLMEELQKGIKTS